MLSMINLILEHGGTLPSTMETRTHSTTSHGTTATSRTAASSKSAAIALALGISIPLTGVFCTAVLTVVCCVLYKCRQRGPPDEKPVHSSKTAQSSVYEEVTHYDVVNASCDKSKFEFN